MINTEFTVGESPAKQEPAGSREAALNGFKELKAEP